jgi:peptidoglycan/xylan/chitin deacetylase (PgdA/CDA1 family)
MTDRHHSHFRGSVAIAALACAGYSLPSLAGWCRWLRPPLGVLDAVAGEDVIVLTFDDGPHPRATPAVLELLAKAAAPAVFFLVGEQVERRPLLAAEIAAAGHEVALHCYRHRSLLRLTPRAVKEDLARAESVIGEATGKAPRFYRPPYGILTPAALVHANRRGWETYLWSRDGRDWNGSATAASVARRLTHELAPGEVLLLHDADHYSAPGSWMATVGALPLLFGAMEDFGFRAELPPRRA